LPEPRWARTAPGPLNGLRELVCGGRKGKKRIGEGRGKMKRKGMDNIQRSMTSSCVPAVEPWLRHWCEELGPT